MTGNESTATLDDPISPGRASMDSYEEPSPLGEAGQHAGESIGHLAERAADVGLKQADRGMETAAEGISHIAESIRKVGADMQESQPQIAGVADTAAEQAERLATYLQQTDAREVIRTVEGVARRQPLVFLGGAFLLGLAASRLIKAGAGSTNQAHGSGYGSRGMTDRYMATRPTGRIGLDELPSEGV